MAFAIHERFPRILAFLALAFAVGACAKAPTPVGISDPYEADNRQTHAFNVAVDRKLMSPAVSEPSDPSPLVIGVSNLAANLDLPGDVANGFLQGRIGNAAHNTARFLVNTTIGVGGIFDPASHMGLVGKPTDFGETLHVWGVGEGDYLVLPVFGPSTQRDALGTVVDIAINPLRFALQPPESHYALGIKLAGRVADRKRYAAFTDSVLYESADSYAQARLLYLQNRRFQLGQKAQDVDFVDPYEDPYGN